MRDLWLVQVISDLEKFCKANGLSNLGSKLGEAKSLATLHTLYESADTDKSDVLHHD